MYFPLPLPKYGISTPVVPHHVPSWHGASVVSDEKFCIPVYILNFSKLLFPLTQLCHEGNLLLHRITTQPPSLSSPLPLAAHFSSQVVVLLLSPLSVPPGGLELPFPAVFTQLLAAQGRSRAAISCPALGDVLSWKPQREGAWGCSHSPGWTGQGWSWTESWTWCTWRTRNADPQGGIFWFF